MRHTTRLSLVSVSTFVLVLSFTMTSVRAATVVDQENLVGTGEFSSIRDWYQSFKPTFDNIVGASMSFGGTGTATIRLYDSIGGTELASGTATGSGLVTVDFGAVVPLIPEVEYFLQLDANETAHFSPSNVYNRGQLWICSSSCSPYTSGNADAVFQTFASTGSTPLPAAVWLFGAGLVLIGRSSIRRRV